MDSTFFNRSFEHSSYDPTTYQLQYYDINVPNDPGSQFPISSQPWNCAEGGLDYNASMYGSLYTDLVQYPQDMMPVAINPLDLSIPPPLESQVEHALSDCTPPTPELVSTPHTHPMSPAQVGSPEIYETFHGLAPVTPQAEQYPMKKDRQKGSANLLRSAKDPDRQHQCTMCIRKFKRRADLARHMKRHQGIRPYECLARSCPLDPSERRFFRADARQRHWKAHPQCEQEFYLTEAGVEWMKKNRNRSQKFRGTHRRLTSRDTSMDSYSGEDDDDADYHD